MGGDDRWIDVIRKQEMAKLESIRNLRLAWTRVLTGQNYSYRNLQRTELEAFAWAEDDNLLQLHNELVNHAFAPSEATKLFIPKQSGLLRPITVLRVRDTIIYQAIANLIAEKVRKRYAEFYFNAVFSSILTAIPNYPHFFRDWKYCRRQINLAMKKAFSEGYVWLGKLDLASFFDIIDHRLLGAILSPLRIDMYTIDLLMNCLTKWSVHPKGYEHGHGVPQGPLASSLMAECVLHTLDKKMTGLKGSIYLRYVDDITVMSTSEREAQMQFARIELICRQLGLIPVIKSQIHKITNLEDLIIDEPSSPVSSSDFPDLLKKLPRKQNDPIRKRFLSCFHRDKIRQEEQLVTKLRFALFRMNPDRRILGKVFLLLTKLPCTYEALNYYLRRFGRDKDIGLHLIKYLESKPLYAIVLANCIETLYFCCVQGQYNKLRIISIGALSRKNRSILRCSAVKVLGIRRNHLKPLQVILSRNTDVYLGEQLLVSLCDVLSPRDKETLLNKYIRSSTPELAMTAAYLLTRENQRLLRGRTTINAWATPILARFGLVRKKVLGDRIGDILKKRYAIRLPSSVSFRKILRVPQYKQALLHLNQAEGAFNTNRAFWVTQMDNFNQIVLYAIFNRELGKAIQYPDVFKYIDLRKLRRTFPNLAKFFKECHKMRCSSFISHAYSKDRARFTTDLKVRGRNKLRRNLKIAYQELVDKV